MNDWRADVLRSLPDEKKAFRVVTFTSAYKLIGDAAFNRRMKIEDFVGRAALSVAAYDADEPWFAVTQNEPPLHDLRRVNMTPRRLYGRGFGPWQIEGMK